MLATLVAKNSQFLRARVGSFLASCTIYDVKGIYVDPDIEPIYHPMTNADVISIINRELRELIWKEVLTNGFEELKYIWETDFTSTIPRLDLSSSNGQETPPESISRKTSIEVKEKESEEKMDTSGPISSTRTSSIGSKPKPLRGMRRASTPPLSISKCPGVDMGRKREKAMVITLVNCVYSCWASSSADQLYPSFELFPLFVHFANDVA